MKINKKILSLAGIISTIVGITFAIPSMLDGRYIASILSTILMIGGIILLSIAFGD